MCAAAGAALPAHWSAAACGGGGGGGGRAASADGRCGAARSCQSSLPRRPGGAGPGGGVGTLYAEKVFGAGAPDPSTTRWRRGERVELRGVTGAPPPPPPPRAGGGCVGPATGVGGRWSGGCGTIPSRGDTTRGRGGGRGVCAAGAAPAAGVPGRPSPFVRRGERPRARAPPPLALGSSTPRAVRSAWRRSSIERGGEARGFVCGDGAFAGDACGPVATAPAARARQRRGWSSCIACSSSPRLSGRPRSGRDFSASASRYWKRARFSAEYSTSHCFSATASAARQSASSNAPRPQSARVRGRGGPAAPAQFSKISSTLSGPRYPGESEKASQNRRKPLRHISRCPAPQKKWYTARSSSRSSASCPATSSRSRMVNNGLRQRLFEMVHTECLAVGGIQCPIPSSVSCVMVGSSHMSRGGVSRTLSQAAHGDHGGRG